MSLGKDHMDIGDEIDILVKHDRRVEKLNRNFGDLLGKRFTIIFLRGWINILYIIPNIDRFSC